MRGLPLSFFHNLSYPRNAILVTSEDPEGRANAMAVAWHSPLSVKPPLYGVAISPKRATYEFIKRSERFGINFLPFELVESLHTCGRVSFREVGEEKLRRAKLTPVRGDFGTYVIEEAYASFECYLVKVIEAGDHDWFVGEVKSVLLKGELRDNIVDLSKVKPTLYMGEDHYATADPSSLRKGVIRE
ncbi:MAG: flavin reductase family protein [Candidatus Korarchaeum sp.]|nr:flavin reductase family protein [Candidatus Korarchaeum sp.]